MTLSGPKHVGGDIQGLFSQIKVNLLVNYECFLQKYKLNLLAQRNKFTVRIKNSWKHTFTPSYALMVVCIIN